MNGNRENRELSRFMMYFKPNTLNELRVLSRMLNIAMVDFVFAAMEAHIFAKEQVLGGTIPPREHHRFVGPRSDLAGKRVRYVMRIPKDAIEKMRDIAYLDNRRFTQVCDDALADFIRFTKEVKNLRNVWLSRADVEAVRGRKDAKARELVASLLSQFKAAETNGRGFVKAV
jgi:hypothetical protein